MSIDPTKPCVVFVHGRGNYKSVSASTSWFLGLNEGLAASKLPEVPDDQAIFADYSDFLEEIRAAIGNRNSLEPTDDVGRAVEASQAEDPAELVDSQAAAPSLPVRACTDCVSDRALKAAIKSRLRTATAVMAHHQKLSEIGIGRLKDILRYLGQDSVRREIRDRVLAQIPEDRPFILIGHSLGSLVALDALAYSGRHPELLITCGSPISLPAVASRLDPRVRDFVKAVPFEWINLFDPGDAVTGSKWVRRSIAGGVQNWHVDNRSEPHSAARYLRHPPVSRAIAAAMSRNA